MMLLTSNEPYSAFATVSMDTADAADVPSVIAGFVAPPGELKLGTTAEVDAEALGAPEKLKLGAAATVELDAEALNVEALGAAGFAEAPDKLKLGAAVELGAAVPGAAGFVAAPRKLKLGNEAELALGAAAPEKLKLGVVALDVKASGAAGAVAVVVELAGALWKLKLVVGAAVVDAAVTALLGAAVVAAAVAVAVAVGTVAPKPAELKLNVGPVEDEPLAVAELPNVDKADEEVVEGAENPENPPGIPPIDSGAARALLSDAAGAVDSDEEVLPKLNPRNEINRCYTYIRNINRIQQKINP